MLDGIERRLEAQLEITSHCHELDQW